MATIQEVIDGVQALSSALVEVKADLDVIKDLVQGLEGGQVATQDQVDALKAAIDSASQSVADIKAEELAIK